MRTGIDMKSDFLSQDLYSTALISPFSSRVELDRLLIVSGYATSAMGFHHLDQLRESGRKLSIDLVYGMIKTDGISKSNHEGFVSLATHSFPGQFSCGYLREGEEVHAKVYIWCSGSKPLLAYTGSANYTQIALLRSCRREVLAECSPVLAYEFFQSLKKSCEDCCSSDIASHFQIGAQRNRYPHVEPSSSETSKESPQPPATIVSDPRSPYYGLEMARLSLVDRKGRVPPRSGLNWGQRPELHRNPDQAYLPVNGGLKNTSFFPDRKIHFTVLADDGEIIQCVRAQDAGKAIHTPHDNSEIGRYVRKRLGLPSGAPVTADHLRRYGRDHIDMYKIDGENFFMDFSPGPRQ